MFWGFLPIFIILQLNFSSEKFTNGDKRAAVVIEGDIIETSR